MRCGAVFSWFMDLHLIVRFSYYTHLYLHLHLLRLVLARWGVVWCGFCSCVGEVYTSRWESLRMSDIYLIHSKLSSSTFSLLVIIIIIIIYLFIIIMLALSFARTFIYFIYFFDNYSCSSQRSVDTHISTKGHATPYLYVYYDRHKTLSWVHAPLIWSIWGNFWTKDVIVLVVLVF